MCTCVWPFVATDGMLLPQVLMNNLQVLAMAARYVVICFGRPSRRLPGERATRASG